MCALVGMPIELYNSVAFHNHTLNGTPLNTNYKPENEAVTDYSI